jgi:hypothetical protein
MWFSSPKLFDCLHAYNTKIVHTVVADSK